MTKQLKGFTITEALLSMLILSIIISLSYLMFNVFNRQMRLFEKENTELLQYNLLNKTIKYDINVAHKFDIENNTIILNKYDDSRVTYRFEKTLILRGKNESVDSFRLTVENYKILDLETPNKTKRLDLDLIVLNETITNHYFFNESDADRINKKYFNED